MAPRNPIIVGLDIGTALVTVVVGQTTFDNKVEIIGVGTSPSRGLRKGVVINIEATVSAISKAVAEAETMAGCEIRSVIAGISGNHIRGFNSHGMVGIKHKEVSSLDVEKVIEAAKAVAIPVDREILHVLPQEFIIDEQDGIREPVGISGVRLESNVHIVTGSIASAQNIVKCANRCGLTVQDIVASPLAAARAVLTPEELELGVALVDIGGGTSDVIVFHGGAVQHTAVVGVGGNHVTSDVAAGLRTPISSAEEIKCRYGSAVPALGTRGDTVEVPSTGGRSSRVLSKQALSEIIEPRITEIFSLVREEVVRAGCDTMLTGGIVITGGSANLPGITAIGEAVFNLPVRTGATGGVDGLLDLVKSPEHAAAVGLVLYGATTKNLITRSQSSTKVGRAFKKLGEWFSEHF